MKRHVKNYFQSLGLKPCDRPMCEMPKCGKMAVDIHHIQPKGMGGSKKLDYPENLIALCRNDHDKAHAYEYSRNELLEIAKRRCEKCRV